MPKLVLNVRIEESEMELLKAYSQQTGRTQTDVVRELIRSLKHKTFATRLLKDLKQGDKFSLAGGKYLSWIEIEEVFPDGSMLMHRGGTREIWAVKDILETDLVFTKQKD